MCDVVFVLHLDMLDKGLLETPQGERLSRVEWLDWLHSEPVRLDPAERELREVLGVR